jgi:hypothetical protein
MQQALIGQHQQAFLEPQIRAQIRLELRDDALSRLQTLFNKREHQRLGRA